MKGAAARFKMGLMFADKVPERVRFFSLVFFLNLLLLTALRLGFLIYFRPPEVVLLSAPVMKALYLGLKFDARLLAWLCLPLLVLSWIPGISLTRSRAGRLLWFSYLLIAEAVIMAAYFVDFGAYSYTSNRLNSSLLIFAEDPAISARMVLSSYPVFRLLLVLAAFLTAYYFFLSRTAPPGTAGRPAKSGRFRRAAIYAAFGLLLAAMIYGKFQRYPLRWSDAYFHPDAFICQLGLNPVLFFVDTLHEKPRNFDPDTARRYYPAVAEHFGVDPDPETLSLRREGVPYQRVPSDTNVVIIFLETFASFKVGAAGNPLESSPRFDQAAEEGILFTRFYVPMENTSRSLFAVIFGTPDVGVDSSSRNPLVINQHTILNAFTKHDKLYFLGGSANWRNISGMLAHNIEGLEIYEEGAYDSPVHDVWGISDLDLFIEANDVLRERGQKPFFAIIQTSGNHRPFLIPENSRGFTPRTADTDTLRKNGFYSPEEYRGFQFLDFCLGYFIDLASREDYFDKTLFVILGDHGTTGGAVDRRFGGLATASVQVPLLFYAPALVGPRRVEKVTSSLDLLPTLASFLGKPYVNQTLGRDIFDPAMTSPGSAFTFTPFRNPPRVGLIEDDFYAIVDPDGSSALYRISSPGPERDISADYPGRAERMTSLTRGFHEMSRYLLYHNPAVSLDRNRP